MIMYYMIGYCSIISEFFNLVFSYHGTYMHTCIFLSGSIAHTFGKASEPLSCLALVLEYIHFRVSLC